MKKTCEINAVTREKQSKSKLKNFVQRHVNKLRQGPLTCPICKEAFNGLSELGGHIKDHCT